MGSFKTGAPDQAQTVLSGVFAGTGTSTAAPFIGRFNFTIWGTFSATINLQKSFDGGATWLIARDVNGNAMTLTAGDTRVIEEVEPGVVYSVNCSAFTSGSPSYRVSAGAAAGNVARLS